MSKHKTLLLPKTLHYRSRKYGAEEVLLEKVKKWFGLHTHNRGIGIRKGGAPHLMGGGLYLKNVVLLMGVGVHGREPSEPGSLGIS